MRLRKGDTVYVLSGKDRGKTGRVVHVYPAQERAMVEGINRAKKHLRRVREDRPWGVVLRENPVPWSRLALFCARCNRPVRFGIVTLADGTKARSCKKCRELLK